jgi:hypothetical protein
MGLRYSPDKTAIIHRLKSGVGVVGRGVGRVELNCNCNTASSSRKPTATAAGGGMIQPQTQVASNNPINQIRALRRPFCPCATCCFALLKWLKYFAFFLVEMVELQLQLGVEGCSPISSCTCTCQLTSARYRPRCRPQYRPRYAQPRWICDDIPRWTCRRCLPISTVPAPSDSPIPS